MKEKLLGLLGLVAACALIGAPIAADASPYVVTLEEVGSNVVATGGGAIDTTGLTLALDSGGPGVIEPSAAAIITGGDTTSGYAYVNISTFTGPANFGSGGATFASSGTGDQAGINGSFAEILVPFDYASDTPLSDTATFDSASFASLGVTPGTYVWTWGPAADQSFTLDILAPTPLPAALPLFVSGLGGLGLLGWRRKRKHAAIAAV